MGAYRIPLETGLLIPSDKRIIKGRPLELDFDRRINVYNKERPHE
jgi:hypothetical protein